MRPRARAAARSRDCALWVVLLAVAAHELHQARASGVLGVDLAPVWAGAWQLLHGRVVYDVVGFVYLPSSALLFVPATALSLHQAADAWAAISIAALAASAVIVVRAWRGPSWLMPVSAIVVLVSGPAMGVRVGNIDMVLPFLFALSVWMMVHERWQGVGALTGLGLAFKPLLVAPALALGWERRWRALAWVVVVPLSLSLPVIALTQGPLSAVHDTPRFPAGVGGVQIQAQSLAVASVAGGAPAAVRLLARLLVLVLGLAVVVVLWRRDVAPAVRWFETSIAAQATLPLLGSFGFSHHVAVVLLLVAGGACAESLGRRWPVLLAVLLLAYPKSLFSGVDVAHTSAISAQQCIALILVLVAMGWCARPPAGGWARSWPSFAPGRG